jgi:lipopolysaccharide exporter
VNPETTPPSQAMPGSDAMSREAIRNAGFSGVRWMAAERLVATIVTLASAIALARLLSPAEFGEAVIAFFVLAVSGTVLYEGVTVPLVQRKTLEEAHLQAAGVIALGVAMLFASLTIAFGATLAVSLFGSESAALVRLAAAGFALNALAVVGQALLHRRLEFGRLALLSLITTVSASSISVALAALGVGAAALVLGPLAAAAIAAALVLWFSGATVPRWRGSAGRELVGFGLPTLGSGLLHTGWKNIDYAVVAARLDPTAVGIYWRAYTFGVQYHRQLTGIVVGLALPLYARAKAHDDRLALRRRLISLQSLIIFPLLGGLILLAPTLVPFALGEAWEPAVVPTQILAVSGMASAVQAGTGPLIVAIGRPGVLLVWNLTSLLMMGAVAFAFAPLGLIWLSAAVTTMWVLRVAIGQELMLRRVAGTAFGELLSGCLPALVATGGMVAGGWTLLIGAVGLGIPEWAAASGVVPVAAAIYAGILATAFPAVLSELRAALAGAWRGKGSRAPSTAEQVELGSEPA